MEYIYQKIKEIRLAKSLTQKDMAKAMETTQAGYQKIETGKVRLTIDAIQQIAKIFEMDFFELLGADDARSDCTEWEQKVDDLNLRVQELQMLLNNLGLVHWDMLDDFYLIADILEQVEQGVPIQEAYQKALEQELKDHYADITGDKLPFETFKMVEHEKWKDKVNPSEYVTLRLQKYETVKLNKEMFFMRTSKSTKKTHRPKNGHTE